MATEAAPREAAEGTAYTLEGTIVEACNCNVLCPCWVGEDPDNGTCDAILAYHVERGKVGDVDVSGMTWFTIGHIPGNVLAGNIRQIVFVDESATPEQVRALTDAFEGRLGGPLADLAELIGEQVGVYQVPIDYSLEEGSGTVRLGDGRAHAAVTPFKSQYGATTTLHESVFSTIPGSPAWVGKAESLSVSLPEHGFEWDLKGTNAIQGEFRFVH